MKLESLNSEIVFGNRGEKISGGEKRRIAIARALYRSASVYIFDEPTNDLDQEMVSIVLKLIEEKKPGNIVIIASHDPRVMAISDSTIHFDHLFSCSGFSYEMTLASNENLTIPRSTGIIISCRKFQPVKYIMDEGNPIKEGG